ncbi:cysteine desulfurase family protein [Niallia endozanthoxylica]|uniref:Cysteine desulfurase n=1 Tax=Niallia endozanthoxylica TaxID=2036016 RepID=A0A5J5HXF5_9BACI|nr:cysteine desulfurase family protein [Niallia endozanthoxylica]KAA9027477.1 cysteine desulfurase [Niallia endozanthoxylica]
MIYFDNSATTKPFPEVIDSFVKVSAEYFGNPSSLHNFGGLAEKLLSQARSQAAKLLSVQQNEIYFTSGGTEGNNLAIKGAAFANNKSGRHLITTTIEHPSVREAIKQLESFGFDVTEVPVDINGRVNVKTIENEIREDTILVSVMHVNNEVGTIQPIREIGQLLKQYPKIKFHVDYVQGVGKVPLNINDCHIDFCTISAHKFHGMKGTGLLFVRDGVKINPLLNGGGQEKNIRSGTENVAGAVSLAKALRLIMEKQQKEFTHLNLISKQLREGLFKIEGVAVNTPETHAAPHIINFSIPHLKSEVFVHALEEKDIYVSTTSACSSKQKTISGTLSAMGMPEERAGSAIRLSLSYTNTVDEVNTVLTAIKQTIEELRKVMK